MKTTTKYSFRVARAEIKKYLPNTIYNKDPFILFLAMLLICLYSVVFYSAIQFNNFFALVFFSLLLGLIGEVLSMVAHEVLHGNATNRNWLMFLFTVPISWITLISPNYWRYWHNYHHRCVDHWTPDRRPFELGFESIGYPRIRSILGVFELFIYKTMHLTRSQFYFLTSNKFNKLKYSALRQFVFSEILAILFFKCLLFYFLPFKIWLYVEFIPLLLQNFLSSMFLVTQHSEKLDPLDGTHLRTFSVDLPKVLAWLFVCSGYHFEHHLFPHVSFRKLAIIRKGVDSTYPNYRIKIKLLDALRKIYS